MEERTGNCGKNFGGLVASGEKLIELGNSWFSAKTIEVVRRCKGLILLFLYGKALNGHIYRMRKIKL